MKKSIRKMLKKNETITIIYDRSKELYYRYLISDVKLIKKRFKERMGREVELENPVKYNDKLQWLKLNWYDPIATKCADKYEVREVVKEKIGAKYLNKLIAVYESTDEIDIDKLPDKFVLKGTHGSGFNIICSDKSQMNWDEEFKKMRRWLRKNYYWKNREWIYKDITPRIICERYLEEVAINKLDNYKIFCFEGEPQFIYVENDNKDKPTIDFYDLKWNRIPVTQYYPNSDYVMETPKELEEMLELSEKLSSGFPHVRVDFYICSGNIIFSELTFFNWGGYEKFSPEGYDEIFGELLDLSKIENMKYNI